MSCKNTIFKTVCLLLSVCITAVVFTGCGDEKSAQNAYRSVNGAVLESQVLAYNSDYELCWDSQGSAVVLKSLKTGEYWSDILYDSFLDGSTSSNGNSPISITVANTRSLKWDVITSHSQIGSNGNILCKKIDGGIRVTYFFDTYRIAIPIDYILNEDSLTVSVDPSKILEDGTDYKLVAVSVAQYLCSVKNDEENGGLLVPTGSGAIMYSAESPDGTRKYTGEVYGFDGARRDPTNLVDTEDIKLPVFGAFGGEKGIMGIIEQGAGAAEITAVAGNERLGYSNVGATLYVRGYDDFIYTYHGQYKGITRRINKDMSNAVMSVTYYPLYGEESSYNGMAKKYRAYLEENNKLNVKEHTESAYAVNILGGTNITTSIFGIPHQKLAALTTFPQAADILSELNESIGTMPVVRMTGYGNKGIRVGSIAGGKYYSSVYGNKKELAELIKQFKDSRIFFDFNIVNFSKSGGGFSLTSDVAKTAILYKAEHFFVDTLRINDEENPYYTIARDSLFEAAEYAIKKAEKYNIENISFSDLGSIAFSDFSDNNYINKYGIEEAVDKVSAIAKKEKRTLSFANANVYAACAADVIFDTPSSHGDYDVFDIEVPFYQMVFHSYIPMYSPAVNLADNTPMAVAKAAAYGMGLGYTLSYNYIDNSDDLNEFRLYGTVYSDNKDLLYENLIEKEYVKMYSAVKDAELVSYEINDDLVSKSVFSNGKTVYVNQSSKSANTPVGELKAYEIYLSEEG